METQTQTASHKALANKLMYLLGVHYGLGVWEVKYLTESYHILHCVENDMEVFIQDDGVMDFTFNDNDDMVYSFDCPNELVSFITSSK